MIRLLSLLAVCLIALPIGAQEKKEVVKFEKRVPQVGELQGKMIRNKSSQSMQGERNGEAMPERAFSSTSVTKRDATILEVAEGKPTKVKLYWREVKRETDAGEGRRMRGGREGRATMTDLSGQTLVLDLTGEAPRVTDEEGGEVEERLGRLVLRNEVSDGQFSGWSPDVIKLLGKSEIAMGETIVLKREAAEQIMRGAPTRGRRGRGRGGRGGEGGEREEPAGDFSASATLKSRSKVLGQDCAVFEIKMSSSNVRDGENRYSKQDVTMTGEFVVGIKNGWLYKLEMDGTQSSENSFDMGERGSVDMTSSGTMKMERQAIYAPAKKKTAEQ